MRKTEGRTECETRKQEEDGPKITVRLWRGCWYVVSGTGKNRHAIKAPSRQAADKLCDALTQDVADGVHEEKDGRPQTIGVLLDSFLRDRRSRPGVRMTTMTTYGYQVATLQKHIGDAPLAGFDRKAVSGYIRRRLALGRREATIIGEVLVLRMALNKAVKRGWWFGDVDRVASGFDLSKDADKAWLRREEASSFSDALPIDGFGIGARLALLCGLRAGETLTRQWCDVDLDGGLLTVGNKNVNGWIWKTKNGKSRHVPLSADLVLVLRKWYMQQGRPAGSAWLIPTREGLRHQRLGWLNEKTKELCSTLGLRETTYHGLRHSFASLALESGVPMLVVSRILGHSSIDITSQRYAHVADRSLIGAAEMLGSHLAGIQGRANRSL